MIVAALVTRENSAVLTAVQWVADVLTGTLATGIAVIAIAAIGFSMLAGRVDLRRGAGAILGCFLLFGAPTIANGLRDLARANAPAGNPVLLSPVAGAAPKAPDVPQNDPYAGTQLMQ